MALATSLLTLIIGLIIGFYGMALYNNVKEILARLKDTREYEQAGIVKPVVTPDRQAPPINLSSSSGGVRRPTPDEYLMANQKARDAKLK